MLPQARSFIGAIHEQGPCRGGKLAEVAGCKVCRGPELSCIGVPDRLHREYALLEPDLQREFRRPGDLRIEPAQPMKKDRLGI